MRPHLRAGVAIYNEGRYHAAHDAWEDRWLDLAAGTDDHRFLQGLIQFTAVVHHAHEGNPTGARKLAERAGEYLDGLPADYRGVDLDDVRPFLAAVAADPDHVEDAGAPTLTHEGDALGYADLRFEATAVAADVLAEADGYDEALVAAAVALASDEVAAEGGGRVTDLVFSFVRDPEGRPVVADRLDRHVAREDRKDADVDGLFD